MISSRVGCIYLLMYLQPNVMINSPFRIGINSHTTFRYIMAASLGGNLLLYTAKKAIIRRPAFFSEENRLWSRTTAIHLLLFFLFLDECNSFLHFFFFFLTSTTAFRRRKESIWRWASKWNVVSFLFPTTTENSLLLGEDASATAADVRGCHPCFWNGYTCIQHKYILIQQSAASSISFNFVNG